MEQMKTTQRLEDLLDDTGNVITPAPDYMQLKLNIEMLCALLWSLFGEQFNYYKELVKLHRILDRKECFTIRAVYTKEICARITWAIIDDGQSFFGQNPVASDFARAQCFSFQCHALNQSWTQCAMRCLSNMQHSQSSGQHRPFLSKQWEANRSRVNSRCHWYQLWQDGQQVRQNHLANRGPRNGQHPKISATNRFGS